MSHPCNVCAKPADVTYTTSIGIHVCPTCKWARRTRESDSAMRALIPELALLSWVPSGFASPSGGPTSDEHPGGKMPKGGGMNGRDWWNRYEQSSDAPGFVKEARATLKHERHSTGDRTVEETPEELTARIRAKRADGWTIRDVSIALRCTETRVRQADRDTTVAKVLELHGKCTIRQIETITGVPKSTVQRIIQAEAA